MATETKKVAPSEDLGATTETALSDKTEYPGQTMGIVALVLAFFSQVPALVLGVIAWMWSNKAGVNNVPAKVAVAVSSVLIVLGILAVVDWVIFLASAVQGFDGFGGWDAMGRPGFRS